MGDDYQGMSTYHIRVYVDVMFIDCSEVVQNQNLEDRKRARVKKILY
jgi:hypothetical protein